MTYLRTDESFRHVIAFSRNWFEWHCFFSSGSHVAVEFIKQSQDCSHVKVSNCTRNDIRPNTVVFTEAIVPLYISCLWWDSWLICHYHPIVMHVMKIYICGKWWYLWKGHYSCHYCSMLQTWPMIYNYRQCSCSPLLTALTLLGLCRPSVSLPLSLSILGVHHHNAFLNQFSAISPRFLDSLFWSLELPRRNFTHPSFNWCLFLGSANHGQTLRTPTMIIAGGLDGVPGLNAGGLMPACAPEVTS